MARGSRGRAGSVGPVVACLIAGALPALAWASTAQAGIDSETVDGYAYLSQHSELPTPPQSGSAPTVFCPGNKTLIGIAGGIDSGQVGHVNSIYPLDGPDAGSRATEALAVDGFNASGDGKTLFAQPVCKRGQRRYVLRERTLSADVDRGFSARCPARTHVTGGGAFVGGDIGDGRLLSTSPFDGGDPDSRPDDGWRIRAANASVTEDSDVTVHAICQRRRPRYEVSGPSTLTAGSEMGVLHDCDNDAHLIGAGADLSLDPDAQVSAILLEDSGADPDLARDDNVTFTLTHRDVGGTDAGYTLTEICARP